jgi:hypothetical protein
MLCRFQTPYWVHRRLQDHQPSSQILIERRPWYSEERRKKKKEEEEEEDTLPSSADFKLHIGYIRDSRNIILLHRPLMKEDLDIEKKEEE